jgi:hypothetical protein
MDNINYCTLFNYKYLSRGLVLYESLCEVHQIFCLYIFAFDDATQDYLLNLKLDHAVIIGLSEFEDQELLKIKNTRSFVEYCWTCTSSVIKYSLEKYNLSSCTYLDADLYFYSSPAVIFNELSDSSVGLSLHNYSSEYDKSGVSGKFCVQFVYFKNNQNGTQALNWWRNECIKWCYARVEDGKFGDQKYLDSFSSLFNEVHIIENQGAGIAPWNIQKFHFNNENTGITGFNLDGSSLSIIFYHFHLLKIDFKKKTVDLRKYEYPLEVVDIFYIPYLRKLLHYENILRKSDFEIDEFKINTPNRLLLKYLKLIRWLGKNPIIRRIYNIFAESR